MLQLWKFSFTSLQLQGWKSLWVCWAPCRMNPPPSLAFSLYGITSGVTVISTSLLSCSNYYICLCFYQPLPQNFLLQGDLVQQGLEVIADLSQGSFLMTIRETTCPSPPCEFVNAAAQQHARERWCGSLTATYLGFIASHRAISCLKQLVRRRGASELWGLGLFSSLEAQMCTAVTRCLFVRMRPACIIVCPLFPLLPTTLPAFHWKENRLRAGGWVVWWTPLPQNFTQFTSD